MIQIKSPYNHEVLAEFEPETYAEAEKSLETAYQFWLKNPRGLPVAERVTILKKLASFVESKQDELATLACHEGGKPITDSRVEISRAINGINLCIDWLNQLRDEEIVMNINAASKNRKAISRKEPIGLIFAISAFNHPFNLIVHQAVTAFAAGCPVLVKPDLRTPISCIQLIELMHASGVPKESCQVVLCDNSVAENLACDKRVRFLNFIGSAKVGWYLKSKLPAGTRCALEHGGLAPAILLHDAPIDHAVTALAKGAFYHAGQVCVSTQRIYVHENRSKDFLQKFVHRAKSFKTGDPMLNETEAGPIISVTELERIDAWVKEAVNEGAELLCGGNKIGDTCYEPTILLNPTIKSKVSTTEIFGPVVCVYTYNDIDDAIALANETRYHFQAAVFGKDNELIQHVVNKLQASAVMVNDHTAFRVDWMPFGGRDESGLGLGGIKYTLEDYSAPKLVVYQELN